MEAPDASRVGPRGPSITGMPVEYATQRATTILRPHAVGGHWFWSLDPYEGCGFACAFCPVRQERESFASWREFSTRVGVKVNAAEVLRQALQTQDLEGRPIVLGTRTEPWQQAEERFRITRALLVALIDTEDLDLRIHTRSSLIVRDLDLLRAISERNHLTVTFSLASLSSPISRLMEPHASPALGRLSALETLARAGIAVGVQVSPMLVGMEDEELGLGGLLTRVARAGARFASYRFVSLEPGQREQLQRYVTTACPELGLWFRHVLGARTPTGAEWQRAVGAFEGHCARLGLMPLHHPLAPRLAWQDPPVQLPLPIR